MKLPVAALVLGLVAAGLGVAFVLKQRDNRELTAEATRLSRQNADLRYELKQATKQAEEVGQRAVVLDSQLGSAKSRTTATETKSVQLTRELTETKSLLTEREQREVTLMAELADLRQRVATVETSRGEVAAAPVGAQATPPASMPVSVPVAPVPVAAPEPAVDVSAYNRRIAQLEEQLTQMLTRALADPLPTEAAEVAPEPKPATVRYQVVRVGPRDSFVVLDYGSEHGARPNDIIRLRRGTSELAQVQISDARPRFSLAQVLPATLKGQLQTGDLVVFTN